MLKSIDFRTCCIYKYEEESKRVKKTVIYNVGFTFWHQKETKRKKIEENKEKQRNMVATIHPFEFD